MKGSYQMQLMQDRWYVKETVNRVINAYQEKLVGRDAAILRIFDVAGVTLERAEQILDSGAY